MRRIAALIDPPDVIGILGLIVVLVFVAQYDLRLAGIVAGLALLFVAWIYSTPRPPEPEPPPTPPKAD